MGCPFGGGWSRLAPSTGVASRWLNRHGFYIPDYQFGLFCNVSHRARYNLLLLEPLSLSSRRVTAWRTASSWDRALSFLFT